MIHFPSRLRLTVPVPAAAWLIGQSLLLNAVSIPVTAYIVRSLGPAAYGTWATASALVAAATCLAAPGLGTLFAREVAQNPENAPNALADQLGLRGLLALIVMFLATLASFGLGYGQTVTLCVLLGGVGLICVRLVSAFADLLQALDAIRLFSAVNFVAGLCLTVTSAIVVWRGAGPVGLTAAYVSGPLIQCVLLWVLVNQRFFRVQVSCRPRQWHALLKQAKVVGAKQILLSLQDRLETLLVPRMVGVAAGGFFFAGIMPASRLLMIPDGLATAAYSKIAGARPEDKAQTTRRVYGLLGVSLGICLPLACLLWLASDFIARVLFPHAPEMGHLVLRLTIWSLPLQGVALPMLYSLEAGGRAQAAAQRMIVASLAGSLLSFCLIGHFGLVGACWGWVGRSLLQVVLLAPAFYGLYPPNVFPAHGVVARVVQRMRRYTLPPL